MTRNLHQGTDKSRPQERQDSQRYQEPIPNIEERERVVYPQGDDEWIEQQAISDSDGRIYSSREDAIRAAREHLRREGGGELTVRGSNGEVEDKEYVEPDTGDKEARVSIGRGSEAEAGFGVEAQEASGGGVNRPVKDK